MGEKKLSLGVGFLSRWRSPLHSQQIQHEGRWPKQGRLDIDLVCEQRFVRTGLLRSQFPSVRN